MVKIFLYPISQTVTNTQSSHQRGQIASVCVCVILPVCDLTCLCSHVCVCDDKVLPHRDDKDQPICSNPLNNQV